MRSIFVFLCAMGVSAMTFAQSIVTVDGAGQIGVDGRYFHVGEVNGVPRYEFNNNGVIIHMYKDPVYMGGTYWAISSSLDSTGNTTDWLYTYNDAGDPMDPTDGTWIKAAGDAPAPFVTFNQEPMMSGQTFTADENLGLGASVATVLAIDPDTADNLTFSILSGNINNALAINPATGELTVNDAAEIDYETNPFFAMLLEVTDDGSVPLSTLAIVRVDLNDLNEAPTSVAQTFDVDENSIANTIVGTFMLADEDANDTHTYAITSGNTNLAYKIDANTGVISVNDPLELDYEDPAQSTFAVTATDNGGLTTTASVTVNLNDVNEAPVIPALTFNIAENSVDDALIGTVISVDPEVTQTSTYAIVNTLAGEPITINHITGDLTVKNASALDHETNSNLQVIVEVTDNGTPVQSSQRAVTVIVDDANDAPTVNDITIQGTEDTDLPFSGNFFSAGFSDQDGDALVSVELISLPKHGQLIMDNATPLAIGNVIDLADWARVEYVPNANYHGTDAFKWVASDAQYTATAPASLDLVIAPVNDPPVKIGAIADISVQEDASIVIGHSLLSTVFDDVENGGNLTYSVLENTNEGLVDVVIDANHQVNLVFWPDANGQATVTIRATDNSSYFLTEQFTVNVGAVQDLPTDFAVNYPFNEVPMSELSNLNFDWNASNDVDGDAVTYTLKLTGDDGTNLTINSINTDEYVMNGVGTFNLGATYWWYVEATDGIGTVTSSNTLGFKVADVSTGVEDVFGSEADDLNVSSYPNPFTSTVTIAYDLPTDAQVVLKVYNTVGGEVATIVNEKQQAGNHQFVWGGKDNQGTPVANGYYIYQINVNDGVSEISKSWKMLKF